MRKVLRTLTTLLLFAALAVPVFAAGGTEGATAGEEEVMTIQWLGRNLQGHRITDGNPIQQKLEEMYNIKIENVPVDVYNAEQRNLLYATGEPPDVYVGGDTQALAAQGVIREIPEDFLNQRRD